MWRYSSVKVPVSINRSLKVCSSRIWDILVQSFENYRILATVLQSQYVFYVFGSTINDGASVCNLAVVLQNTCSCVCWWVFGSFKSVYALDCTVRVECLHSETFHSRSYHRTFHYGLVNEGMWAFISLLKYTVAQ